MIKKKIFFESKQRIVENKHGICYYFKFFSINFIENRTIGI